MIYITGDIHRDFSRLNYLEYRPNDMLIILGDVGINYYLNEEDNKLKKLLSSYNLKLFCVRGNHEERPENINSYNEIEMFSGKVYVEDKFPNLVFAKDGEVYNMDGMSVLVIGGAYSIDKPYRIAYGYNWFSEEQLSDVEMKNILKRTIGKHFDIILSHTCPYKYEPREIFLNEIDQSKVDKSMEYFLDKVEKNVDYDKWYCGHYHINKKIDKLEFMYKEIKVFDSK